jgi:hypothetical protein
MPIRRTPERRPVTREQLLIQRAKAFAEANRGDLLAYRDWARTRSIPEQAVFVAIRTRSRASTSSSAPRHAERS